MPVGTVRGRYELDAPALRTLHDLEKQGIRTQAQMKAVADEMDRVGGQADAARLREYNQAQADVRRGAERMGRTMRDEWRSTTRVVRMETRRQVRAIAELEAALDRVGARRVAARVSVRGAVPATAKLAALDAAMDRVDRGSIRPSVGLSPPRAPVTQSMPRVTGGGGGGGGFGGGGRGLRSVGLGPFNLGSGTGLGLIGAGLPALRAVGGAGVAVAGSAGMGLAGAGALGLAGGGALAAGIGGTMLIGKTASGQIGEATKATQKYADAVRDFGRASDQARNAKRELDQAMAVAPRGTRQLLRDVTSLRKEWTKLTQPGQQSFMDLLRGGVRSGRRLMRRGGAAAANRVTGAVSREGIRFGNFLAGPTGQRGVGVTSRMFDENLGSVRGAGQFAVEAGVNVMQASRPFLREATQFIRTWTRGWATGTRDVDRTRAMIGRMVDNLKSWVRLTRATGGLLGSLAGAGSGDGQRMVDKLTLQLREWQAWIRSNPRQVRDFFRRTVDSTVKLAGALGKVAEALFDIAGHLTPVLDRFSQLVSLAGKLGLLTPGAGALAFGAMRGARGGGAGGGGGGGGFLGMLGGRRGGGRGAGAAPRAGSLGGLRGTASYAGGTYGLARSFGYGRTASAAAAAGGVAQAGLGAAGRVGMGALRGAGKAFWPIALGMGVLDFANFDGGVGGRLQNAASGATLGLIPRPVSSAEHADRGLQAARKYLGGLGTGSSLTAQSGAIGDLRGRIEANRARAAYQGRRGIVGASRGGAVMGTVGAPTEGERKELAAQNKELRAALAERVALYKEYRRARDRELNNISRQKGAGFAAEFQQGFAKRSKRDGAEAALTATTSGVLGQMRGMRTTGARVLAQNTLTWARAAAQKNPALEDEYKTLVSRIVGRFKGLGRDISVVNGQILDGSKREWGGIADAIASQARRGVDQTSAEWQRLNQLAVGALVQQGYSRADARSLLRGLRGGGPGASHAKNAINMGANAYSGAKSQSRRNQRGDGIGRGQRRFTGDGPGSGLRHGAAGSQTAANGSLMGAKAALGGYASLGSQLGLRVSSGLRPGAITSSGNASYHGSGDAIDMAGAPGSMMRYANEMATRYGSQLEELIYSPLGWGIKNGRRVPLSYFGAAVVADHYDHVHVADTDPAAGGGGLRGGAPGGAPGAANGIRLNARKSGLGGVTGLLADRAAGGMAAGLEQAVNAAIGAGGPGGAVSAGGSYNKAALARLWRQANPGLGDPNLMAAIALAESGGNPGARNPSGASGLWQILGNPFPGNPMDPVTNARMAGAKFRTQGLGAWEAYTLGMHKKFMGDGPGKGGRSGTPGRRISSTPQRNFRTPVRRAPGRLGGGVNVNIHGPFHVRNDGDIERIADAVGAKLLAVLNGDSVSDGRLV